MHSPLGKHKDAMVENERPCVRGHATGAGGTRIPRSLRTCAWLGVYAHQDRCRAERLLWPYIRLKLYVGLRKMIDGEAGGGSGLSGNRWTSEWVYTHLTGMLNGLFAFSDLSNG